MDREKWADVVGYEGIYIVSTFGRVKSKDRESQNRWSGPHKLKGKVLKRILRKDGQVRVALSKNGKPVKKLVARLVLAAFIGPCPMGKEARHFPDRNPLNCRLDNLSYRTHKENCADKKTHGTNNHGSRHSMATIDEKTAKKIKEMIRNGFRQCEIRKELNLNKYVVPNIVNHRSWSHVEV